MKRHDRGYEDRDKYIAFTRSLECLFESYVTKQQELSTSLLNGNAPKGQGMINQSMLLRQQFIADTSVNSLKLRASNQYGFTLNNWVARRIAGQLHLHANRFDLHPKSVNPETFKILLDSQGIQ